MVEELDSPAAETMNATDAEHLRTLTIFHYVYAGMVGLGILFLLFHATITTFVFTAASSAPSRPNNAPPVGVILGIFGMIYGCAGMILIIKLVGNILSAKYMKQRRKRMFSVVVAAINCLAIPFGTILGVFTLIELSKDSVRQGYRD